MLEITRIRENSQEIIERLKVRNIDATEHIENVLAFDKDYRASKHDFEVNQAEANKIAKEIGMLFKQGKGEEANQMKARSGELKEANKSLHEKTLELEQKIREELYLIPNIPNPLVPAGNAEEDNDIVDEEGLIHNYEFDLLPHWDLAKRYDIIDFELGNKVTGAGFPFYKGKGAKLQRAIINFCLTEGEKAGYLEVQPPLLVNEASGIGTGQLPDKEGQMYHTELDHLYLIPTAEIPITNIFRDVILNENELPTKYIGHTPCFRREAGSYGKHVRGLNRLHQFDKVEIVQVCHPDKSYETLDQMVDHVKGLLRKLGLKFRVARLCGGDIGFTSALTYDMEVYSVAQDRWLEVSSISNFESFQANRLKLRYRGKDNKTHLAHTLNGSALALPRIVAAILEMNQTKDGIQIPKVLQPFTGFDKIN